VASDRRAPGISLDSADRQGKAVPEAKITRLNEKIATLREEIQRLAVEANWRAYPALNIRVFTQSGPLPEVVPVDESSSCRNILFAKSYGLICLIRSPTVQSVLGGTSRPPSLECLQVCEGS